MATRVPPHSMEAEQSIIGGLMLDREALDQVGDMLTAEDFYRPVHAKIFNVIKDLNSRNQPVDIITVTNLLQMQGDLEGIGGPEYLLNLLDKTISSANIVSHAKIVRDKAILRELIKTNMSLIEKAYEQDFTDVESFIDTAESEIFRIAETKTSTGLVG
ncbi:MAG TPA: DnaB-like helicase N-terminal domain-containing protein, partial [Pseudobdellovibrionaceae bacterium]|nr:DnaB-like helicase N-terminal domain-containing protein [Pseudobdellovibrionaceae bacterium]